MLQEPVKIFSYLFIYPLSDILLQRSGICLGLKASANNLSEGKF